MTDSNHSTGVPYAESFGQLILYTALVVKAQELVAIRTARHATAASAGFMGQLANAAGNFPVGKLSEGEISNTGDSLANQNVTIGNRITRGIAVVGTSAKTDVLAPIYRTDAGAYTITRPAEPTVAVGFVLQWYTGTTCDIYEYSIGEMAVLMLQGGNRKVVNLGSYDWTAVADGVVNAIDGLPRGKIVEIYAVPSVATTGAGGDLDVNLEIDGTNVTGGVVAIPTASPAGTKISSTAITAENEIGVGSTVEVEVANAAGTRTTGQFNLYAIIEGALDL